MVELMTLADFARSIGISPATARQWKRRGRIVERDSGFVVDAGVTPESVTLQRDSVTDETVTKRDSVTGIEHDSVTERDSVTGIEHDSVTERDSVPFRMTPTLRSRGTGFPVVVTPEAFEALLSRLDACERDNAALQDRVAVLETDIAEMREWINNLQRDFQDRLRLLEGKTAGPHPSWAPSRRALMDPPSSDWGA